MTNGEDYPNLVGLEIVEDLEDVIQRPYLVDIVPYRSSSLQDIHEPLADVDLSFGVPFQGLPKSLYTLTPLIRELGCKCGQGYAYGLRILVGRCLLEYGSPTDLIALNEPIKRVRVLIRF